MRKDRSVEWVGAMVFVWIVLVVLGVVLGVGVLQVAFAVGGNSIVPRSAGSIVVRAVLAFAPMAGAFVVAYAEQNGWMIVGSYVGVGLLALFALLIAVTSPSPKPIRAAELATQLEAYISRPGSHAMSLCVQGDLLATMRHGRLTRQRLIDGSCPYCFVERQLTSMLDVHTSRLGEAPHQTHTTATVIGGYRDRLQRGPTVEVHMRRHVAAEPWHIEFAMPTAQARWEFVTAACAEHRPTGAKAES